jgi:uncharacterized BrkB/YihY/UPF0761 family membrane protein
MILQLFVFAFLFAAFGIYSFVRRKRVLGWFFVLLGSLTAIIGWIVVTLYPQTLPF